MTDGDTGSSRRSPAVPSPARSAPAPSRTSLIADLVRASSFQNSTPRTGSVWSLRYPLELLLPPDYYLG